MLQLNMLMNGFRVTAIVSQFRSGQQDGAIILGRRAEDNELVVAEVDQFQIDRPEPAESWMQGHYFPQGPDDTDLNSEAAIKAGAIFGERTGIAAMVEHDKSMTAERLAKKAAQDALAKVLAAVEGKTYSLVDDNSFGEGLNPKQVDILLRGDNEWDFPEFSYIDEAVSDERYTSAISEIKDILDDDEYEALGDADLLDEARFAIEERDTSDMIDSLLRATGSVLVRYDLGVPVDTDYTSSDEDRREMALTIVAALGVVIRNEEPHEALITAIIDILIESQDGEAYMFWYADVAELVKAARPFQQARFTEKSPAPPATITFENVELLVLNRSGGSGYSARLPGAFTITFDATKLVTDEGDDGYSWNDVAGLVASAFKGDVTIAPVATAQDQLDAL